MVGSEDMDIWGDGTIGEMGGEQTLGLVLAPWNW